MRAYLQRQESRALAAAALPQLRAQLALLRNHRLEGELQATLADWFRGEPEWEPYRREFRIYAVSADEGRLELIEGAQEADLASAPLVAEARRNGVASAWLPAEGPHAAAAARVAVPNRRTPAVVLVARALDAEALADGRRTCGRQPHPGRERT